MIYRIHYYLEEFKFFANLCYICNTWFACMNIENVSLGGSSMGDDNNITGPRG